MKSSKTTQEVTPSVIQKTLDWAYDKAVNGVPGLGTAQDLANDFLKGDKPLDKKINSLVRWQNTKAATTGFLTGLGGLWALPVSIPADLASTLFIQIRMIAAIAIMNGYDAKDDRVKSLIYVCLVANSVKDAIEQFGIKLGEKFATVAVGKISSKALQAINQKVGYRLFTKFGEKGLINIGKGIPLVGGFINAGLDVVATSTIAKVSKKTFTTVQLS